jgi:hypothetical protein
MIAQSEIGQLSPDRGVENYLGISRGMTRQLRTVFAPAPQPQAVRQRTLRVLIVGDPADDAPLAGAQAEAQEIAACFERFNELYAATGNRVEVVTLIGPAEATPTAVLSRLMLEPFDVLHYAGHCVYEKDNLAASGWIFSGDTRITAAELSRLDRVPRFVFSNACESGITPERAAERSANLAPSFAEAFFGRGVVNFVCTAWPVDDAAARHFALELYRRLLGLGDTGPRGEGFAPMHIAMREARDTIARTGAGYLTWGAYQHYGDPQFRLFIASDAQGESRPRRPRPQRGPRKRKAQAKPRPRQRRK